MGWFGWGSTILVLHRVVVRASSRSAASTKLRKYIQRERRERVMEIWIDVEMRCRQGRSRLCFLSPTLSVRFAYGCPLILSIRKAASHPIPCGGNATVLHLLSPGLFCTARMLRNPLLICYPQQCKMASAAVDCVDRDFYEVNSCLLLLVLPSLPWWKRLMIVIVSSPSVVSSTPEDYQPQIISQCTLHVAFRPFTGQGNNAVLKTLLFPTQLRISRKRQ